MSYLGGQLFIHESDKFQQKSTPNCPIAIEFAKNRCKQNEFIKKDGRWDTEYDRAWLSGLCTQKCESVYVDVREIFCIDGHDGCGSVFLGRCYTNDEQQKKLKEIESSFNKK